MNHGALLTDTRTPIDVARVAAHRNALLRLATSIRSGRVTASAMLRRLSVYPRQNSLAVAPREVGRLERSFFVLNRLRDADPRRRPSGGLNEGESRNSLARAIFFCRLGELRDRTFENQAYRISGVDGEAMRHVAPLGWEHILLTGAHSWDVDEQPAPATLPPLRARATLLLAA